MLGLLDSRLFCCLLRLNSELLQKVSYSSDCIDLTNLCLFRKVLLAIMTTMIDSKYIGQK